MKTFVEINGTTYEIVPQKFGCENWKPSCEQCAAAYWDGDVVNGCSVTDEFNCMDYDCDEYNVHLELLATPSIGLNTPSEARRRAI